MENLIQSLATYDGKPSDVLADFQNAAANVVQSFAMSTRYEKDDPIRRRFKELYYEGFIQFAIADQCLKNPLMKFSDKARTATRNVTEMHKESSQIVNNVLDKRVRDFDPTKSENLMDAYLHEFNNDLCVDKSKFLLHSILTF